MPNSITVCESFGLEWNSKSTHIPIHMTLKPLGVQMVTWTTSQRSASVPCTLCVIFTILVSFLRDNALFALKAKINVV